MLCACVLDGAGPARPLAPTLGAGEAGARAETDRIEPFLASQGDQPSTGLRIELGQRASVGLALEGPVLPFVARCPVPSSVAPPDRKVQTPARGLRQRHTGAEHPQVGGARGEPPAQGIDQGDPSLRHRLRLSHAEQQGALACEEVLPHAELLRAARLEPLPYRSSARVEQGRAVTAPGGVQFRVGVAADLLWRGPS